MPSLKLFPEQEKGYRFAIDREAAALLFDQRTGKTFITMAVIRKLSEKPVNSEAGGDNNFCGLIVGPLSNKETTWVAKTQEYLKWVNVTTDFEEFKKLPNPRLLILHYESFVSLIQKLVRYKKFTWCCFDEAQRIAARGNRSSRAAARMSWVPRRMVLTGTPQDRRETEYFGIFRFLAPDVFGKNWDKFQSRFMDWQKVDMSRVPPGTEAWKKKLLKQKILKNKAEFKESKRSEFVGLLEPYCLRLDRVDAGIHKARVHQVVIPMSRRQRSIYRLMTRRNYVNLRGQHLVTAPLEVTLIAKQRQIASGFMYDDDRQLHWLSDNKLRWLEGNIDRLSKPLVIFTTFRPDNLRIYQWAVDKGYSSVRVTGSTKKSLRPKIWEDFQKGVYDVIVVQIKTGGVGVDLWKANTAVIASMSHSFRDTDQAMARLDVYGKDRPSEFYILSSQDSVDTDLFSLVIEKGLNAAKTLNQLKRKAGCRKRKPRCPSRKRRK